MIRDRLSENERAKWAGAAVTLIQGVYLDESRACFEWALDCFAQIHGPSHDFISVTTNGIGDVLQALNELEGMREYFEYARRSDTAVYRHVLRHPSATVRSQFQFEHFLRYDEAHYGPDHPKVAITLTNIGHMLREASDLEEAREHFEWALKIDEAAYGSEHQQAAIRLNNLGRVLRKLGDLAGARQCYERALRIDTAVYGSEHPNMAVRLNNLGRLLQDEGDLISARTHYKQAWEIFHQCYGDSIQRHRPYRRIWTPWKRLSERKLLISFQRDERSSVRPHRSDHCCLGLYRCPKASSTNQFRFVKSSPKVVTVNFYQFLNHHGHSHPWGLSLAAGPWTPGARSTPGPGAGGPERPDPGSPAASKATWRARR